MGSFAVWPVGSSRPASHSTRLRPVGVLTPRRHLPPASGVRPLLDTTWKLPQRHQTRGPSLGKAPARGPWGFSHRGTSRRQTATSTHACFRAGNGEERGWTQHTRNTTTLPFANPQPHRIHPASVRGPWTRHRLEIATALAGSTRPGAQPSARRPPTAHGGSIIRGPQGARRPPA